MGQPIHHLITLKIRLGVLRWRKPLQEDQMHDLGIPRNMPTHLQNWICFTGTRTRIWGCEAPSLSKATGAGSISRVKRCSGIRISSTHYYESPSRSHKTFKDTTLSTGTREARKGILTWGTPRNSGLEARLSDAWDHKWAKQEGFPWGKAGPLRTRNITEMIWTHARISSRLGGFRIWRTAEKLAASACWTVSRESRAEQQNRDMREKQLFATHNPQALHSRVESGIKRLSDRTRLAA